jgi:hypothetical protein
MLTRVTDTSSHRRLVPPAPSRTAIRSRLTAANQPVVVFGVIPAAGLEPSAKVGGAEVLAVRQLGVLLEGTTLGAAADAPRQVARYRAVVEEAFAERNVVPVPYRTVFRSRTSVTRWMELHYSPLQEALDFVADRATMRVTVGVGSMPASQTAAVVLDGHLWTVLRRLKGDAVAAIPVVAHADHVSGADRSAACAYLVDRDAIAAFEKQVANLTSAESHLRFNLVGPLPAYDFIKMDFGG